MATRQSHEILRCYNCDDYNFPDLSGFLKRGRKKRTGNYYNIPVAYDIETTSYNGVRNCNDDGWIKEPYGEMYHWQICFHGDIIMGRTWDEFEKFIARMIEFYNINSNTHMIFYSHNLSFEWQFTQHYIGDVANLFAVKSRTPLYVRMVSGLEFRCSYKLSNMSLEEFCKFEKGNNYLKASGDLDYSIIRNSASPLSWLERKYCASDVKALYEAIMARMRNDDDDLESIPLTSTGYVRRKIRGYCDKYKSYHYRFKQGAITPEVYALLRRAAGGGDTHANRYYSNRIWFDCDSYDVQSSYPYIMVTKKFPLGPFIKYGKIKSKSEFDKLINSKACIFRACFKNIRCKLEAVDPILSSSKCNIKSGGEERNRYDNGRVLYAYELVVCLTDIDYKELVKYYTADSVIITDMYISDYGYLPEPIRQGIMDLFAQKCRLKYEKELAEKAGDWEKYEDLDYLYGKCKNLLNGIFGMMFTDPVHAIFYENDDYTWDSVKVLLNDYDKIQKELDKFYNSRKSFVHYYWGVWTTAHARAHLHRLIDTGGQRLYWDTDSLKGFNLNHDLIAQLNNEIIKEDLERDAYCDIEGKRYYLGVYEKEKPMKQFITMGAKKYCYEDMNENLHITLSGVRKNGAIELECIENFKKGFVFRANAGKKLYYNDSLDGPSIAVLDNTYTLGLEDEYDKLLEECGLNVY